MTLNLFLLLCLVGFTASRMFTVPPKYCLINQTMIWSDAQSYCRRNYSDLATVVSDDDWMRLNKEVANNSLTTPAWVGLYSGWSWSFNDIPLKEMTWSSWAGGQPDNYGGIEDCSVMGPYGYWRDYPCSTVFPFVCFNDSLSGASRFIGVTDPLLNWTDAQAYCRNYYTDLATTTCYLDNIMVKNFTWYHGLSWIGLFRDTWKWSDRTNPSTLPWLPSAPNNLNGIEDCGAVSGGMFDDRNCSEPLYFFCQTKQVREKQIMKVKLISDETVHDPAVQSKILELVRQKLKEHGMLKDTVVTWRVRSGGQIFQKKQKNDL